MAVPRYNIYNFFDVKWSDNSSDIKLYDTAAVEL